MSNVQFTGLGFDKHHGPIFRLTADAPPGPARNPSSGSRFAFWKFGKRLMSGGMVALVSKKGGKGEEEGSVSVRVGVVSEGMSRLLELLRLYSCRRAYWHLI